MKLKSVFFVLMMVIASIVMAQEKYEQAVIKQPLMQAKIWKSVEGQAFEEIKIKFNTVGDATAMLTEIAKMRDQGWEVWNASTSDGVTAYFLRRKIK